MRCRALPQQSGNRHNFGNSKKLFETERQGLEQIVAVCPIAENRKTDEGYHNRNAVKKGSSKSIRAVLLNLSQSEGLVFQQVVTRYLHERLLYRLSLSEYRYSFILKGGNLLYAIEGLHVRPTMDIDIDNGVFH
jgi:hypothetical protein